MYGPAARRKTDFQDDEHEVQHQCIGPRVWMAILLRTGPRINELVAERRRLAEALCPPPTWWSSFPKPQSATGRRWPTSMRRCARLREKLSWVATETAPSRGLNRGHRGDEALALPLVENATIIVFGKLINYTADEQQRLAPYNRTTFRN